MSGAYGLVVMTSPSHETFLGENEVKEYIDIFELSGITKGHKKEVQRSIENYLKYLNYKINKKKSIIYFKQLQDKCSIAGLNPS